jgi:hypothetical protein
LLSNLQSFIFTIEMSLILSSSSSNSSTINDKFNFLNFRRISSKFCWWNSLYTYLIHWVSIIRLFFIV